MLQLNVSYFNSIVQNGDVKIAFKSPRHPYSLIEQKNRKMKCVPRKLPVCKLCRAQIFLSFGLFNNSETLVQVFCFCSAISLLSIIALVKIKDLQHKVLTTQFWRSLLVVIKIILLFLAYSVILSSLIGGERGTEYRGRGLQLTASLTLTNLIQKHLYITKQRQYFANVC